MLGQQAHASLVRRTGAREGVGGGVVGQGLSGLPTDESGVMVMVTVIPPAPWLLSGVLGATTRHGNEQIVE